VWSIRLEAETDDLDLRNEILAAAEAWRERCDTMSVSTREDSPPVSNRRYVTHTNSHSVRLEAVAVVSEEHAGEDDPVN
jgi:hypothetical protein